VMNKNAEAKNNVISTVIGWSADALLYVPRLIASLFKSIF